MRKTFLANLFVLAILVNVSGAQSRQPIDVASLSPAVQKSYQSTVRVEDGVGQATGAVVGDGTYILTASHVVRAGLDAHVKFWTITTVDGRKYKAIVASDRDGRPIMSFEGDTALLKLTSVKPGELYPVPIAGQNPRDRERVYSCSAGHEGNLNFHICEPFNEPRYFIGGSTRRGPTIDRGKQINIICNSVTGGCFQGTSGGPFINEKGEIIGLASSGEEVGGTKGLGYIATLESIRTVMNGIPQPPSKPPYSIQVSSEIYIRMYCGNTPEEVEKCRLIYLGAMAAARASKIKVLDVIITAVPAGDKRSGKVEKTSTPPTTGSTSPVVPDQSSLEQRMIDATVRIVSESKGGDISNPPPGYVPGSSKNTGYGSGIIHNCVDSKGACGGGEKYLCLGSTVAHNFKDKPYRVVAQHFEDGKRQAVDHNILILKQKYDSSSDVAMFAICSNHFIQGMLIAGSLPEVGEKVYQVGCPEKQDASVLPGDCRVLEKNPESLVCSQAPVYGRSGGGLFNEKGEVVGVCKGIIGEEKMQGIYPNINALLDLWRSYQGGRFLPLVTK